MARESKTMTAEQFEALLLEVRNGATAVVADLADEAVQGGDENAALTEDARSVWHAAEVALGMLHVAPTRYRPKKEAVAELAALLPIWKGEEG